MDCRRRLTAVKPISYSRGPCVVGHLSLKALALTHLDHLRRGQDLLNAREEDTKTRKHEEKL
jgi:hypothetical protein